MYKFLKKTKFFKIISFILVAVFAVNVAGCVDDNGVESGQIGGGNANVQLGVGNDITGYTIYSQSTFDPMTKELFMGYLLSGRNFTLVVVPGTKNEGDDKDENPYLVSDPENYLYAAAQRGILQYDDTTAKYINYDKKALMYYVTNLEFVSWLNSFEADDNFASNALEFSSSKINLEKPSRFKCKDLVNMGSGLNATDFCGSYSGGKLSNGIITNEKTIKYDNGEQKKAFNDKKEGGMILFFGFNSIEGYMTYEHIKAYTGSSIANELESNDCSYTPGGQKAFDFEYLLTINNNEILNYINEEYIGGGMTIEYFRDMNKSSAEYEALVGEIVSKYTENLLSSATGCKRLKITYQLLEQGLLTDNQETSLYDLRKTTQKKLADSNINDEMKDKYNAIYDLISIDRNDEGFLYSFDKNAEEEAFNIKLSVALFNRYSELIELPDTDSLVNSGSYSSILDVTDKNNAINLANGTGNYSDDSYLFIVTAKGFIFDRGDEENRVAVGAADMFGMSAVLQELVKMDACPNATIALEMYNMLANLKIAAGIAITVTGVTAVAAAAIGLTVASIISKVAAVSAVTPVPGGRVAALVLVAVAGLITIGVGLYTLFSGAKDKANIKGMGASNTNYCATYKATFNQLFKTITLTVPVYHYEIAKDNDNDGNDAITMDYCDGDIVANGTCNGNLTQIPLYYYADRELAGDMNLSGMPAILYYKKGKLVDYISGATTPSFIIEALRMWGLLSMREMVYKATIEVDADANKSISVYRTTNTNARTMTINKARYCYTLEYELNVWNNTGSSFCYFDSANDVGTKEISIPYKSGELIKLFSIRMPNNDSDISKKIIDKYSSYFDDKVAYKFYSYKDAFFTTDAKISVAEENQKIILNSFSGDSGKNSTLKYSIETTTYETVEVEEVIDGVTITKEVTNEIVTLESFEVSGIKVESNNKSYLIANDGYIYSCEKVNGIYHIYKMIKFDTGYSYSNIKSSLSEMMKDSYGLKEDMINKEVYDNTKEDEYNYNLLLVAFIEYLDGNKKFEYSSEDTTDTTEVSIPLYFTSTIQESPQANFYYDGTVKTPCDSGEYYYKREHWFFGTWYSNECYADSKVNPKKDTPQSAEDAVNENEDAVNEKDDAVKEKYDAEKYQYYTTSVLVATIKISIDSTGKTGVSLEWK